VRCRNREKGFTLIETLVVIVMLTLLAVPLMQILMGGGRASRISDLDSETQQNARVAVDFPVRDIRSAGYEIDYGRGQRGIVHAGPYDIVFNANVEPASDDGSTPGYPSAMDTTVSPSRVPAGGAALYTPGQTFDTGAETIRYTFDSNNDGYVDASDMYDDAIEGTNNPYDYLLVKQVYGFDGSTNGGASQPIALLRGPEPYPDGDYPPPLFTYWYDHDDDITTPSVLWGDTNGDGELGQSEIAMLTPVDNANMARITKVGVTAIGTARAQDIRYSDNNGYRETLMSSEVDVRNEPARSAIITGAVFDDLDANGVRGSGEGGVSGALLMLNNGMKRVSGADGRYGFRVDPGTYTVTETDPTGYTSTTANAVVVNAIKGTTVTANFGDRAIGGYGSILGKVYLWEDNDPPEPTETGVPGVDIYLNTGERDTTSSIGAYAFLVPVSTYSITMDVPEGYMAMGRSTVDRTLASEGDTVMVDFGLLPADESGTIAGTVYLDDNEDGIFDFGEDGIASVTISLNTGDTTLTDADGYYSFTVPPGTYNVAEDDLGGYASTTVNNVTNVHVGDDSTTIVNFGDILESDLSFTVITLGETQRALSITSADLNEDNKGDVEIILGTKYATGVSNLNVWFNKWKNSSTPNSAIFDQSPSYSRSPAEDIYTVANGDLNNDGTQDVISGLTSASGKTLVWITQGGGNKGELPTLPNSYFIASTLGDVLASHLAFLDNDGVLDAVIGTKLSGGSGKAEVWFGDGAGNFTHAPDDVYSMAGAHMMGEVRSVGLGRLVGSPAPDLVVGTSLGYGWGAIEIFRDGGAPNGKFVYYNTIETFGEVNAIVLDDMYEDSEGDIDIIAGTVTGAGVGMVEIWHNNGDGTFGELNYFGYYEPSDTVYINGDVLCLGVGNFDRDIYPDVAVGMRTVGDFSGALKVFQCYGYMPSSGNEWTSPNVGEVITLTINDFNKDWKQDIAVGTRTSLSQGKVVVFFQD
jgi:prepilin-type N-terminal cleavage/methylation domain-containing protein